MPDKTAHMYGKIRIKRGEIVMLKILFQGDSLTIAEEIKQVIILFKHTVTAMLI